MPDISPEELLSFRIAQIDIIVCWAIYICEAMILPTIISALLVIEHFLSKSIRKSDARLRRKLKRLSGKEIETNADHRKACRHD